MKNLVGCSFATVFFLLLIGCSNTKSPDADDSLAPRQEWAIVIHGGAGGLTKEGLPPQMDSLYRAGLKEALEKGINILSSGGSALDAVEKTINILEDNPLFNAGKGAVFNHDGINELDASIMDGSTLAAGAVTCVTDIKNPVSAARAVMDSSGHVMLSGNGASQFARDQGLEIVDPSYFRTEARYNELLKVLNNEKNGTVGCCALDKNGNLAAGTSTGGMTNKRYNRIGDTPIIGAGTYANNNTCAISSTGHGEYFIRWTVAHDISALMEYKGMSVREAASLVINEKLVKAGGSGGVIALDRNGNIAMPFNSKGMFRAYAAADGSSGVYIFKEESKL
ncbi:MAG TPA: isoaspartyl peptidase/L-asparaginase [Bacteroidales bacterium]|nr:isoaspartyl peptidase/L-asparaginase [Bacteroidales bacterium]